MNWAVFGVLWGASLFLNWLFETPEDNKEKLFVGILYTVIAVIVGMFVPAEQTGLGLLIVGLPLIGDLILKTYRHRAMERIYADLSTRPNGR